MAKIAFIGYRKKAIKAAIALGHKPIIWQIKNTPSCKETLIIEPFPELNEKLPITVKQFFEKHGPIDAVIPLTEKSIPASLALMKGLNINYDEKMMAATHDKWQMKETAKQHAIPITPYALLDETNHLDIFKQWGYPVFAKLRDSSGSRGLQIIPSEKALTALKGKNYLIEKSIIGTEMSMEIFFHNGELIFLNPTQYYSHLAINIVPAPLDCASYEELEAFAKKLIQAFKLDDGIAHIECFATQDNLILNELTIRPPGGFIMDLIQLSYGFNPWELLIQIYLNQAPDFQKKAQQFSACIIFHPGKGEIKAIKGVNTVNALPTLTKLHLKNKVGDKIKVRESSGQFTGYAYFASDNYQSIVSDIEQFQKGLIIQLK